MLKPFILGWLRIHLWLCESGFVSSGRTFLASLHTSSMNSSNLCHTAKWSSGASWLRPPSSWTKARATRRYVGGGPGNVLPSHCPHHFERCAMQSHVVALDSSLLFRLLFFGTRRDNLCLSQRHHSVFLQPRARPQTLPCARKGSVGEVPRCCFG